MERQEKGNMDIFGSGIRHRTGVPKAQSSSDADSVTARTFQQTQTEADNATARQKEVRYESSVADEKEIDRLFKKIIDQKSQPSDVQTDSQYERAINILSSQTEIDNATTQQTKADVRYERRVADEKEIDRPFEKISDQKSQPTDVETDSQDEREITISSTDNATTQQTKAVKFLELVKWSCQFLPEVTRPDRRIELGEKVVMTVTVLIIFTVFCQMPLFSIRSPESVDPFYHMRVTWASNRGTFMEFGIMPVGESQTALQMLTGFKIINVHDSPYNHALLNGAQRLLALLLTVVLSVLFIITGMFGELEQIGVAFFISMQLFIAGLIILLLNDLVKKGYCLGTEIYLFIVSNICGTMIWKAFSPVTVYTDQGAEFEGTFVFLLQLLSTRKDKLFILKRAFFRQNLPNLVNFLATFFVFVTIIYLKEFYVKLPMRSTIYERHRGFFRINLLYTSFAPLLLQSTLVHMFNLFAQVLSSKFNENVIVNLLGVWADVRSDGPPRSYPIGGLCYYMSPPITSLQVTQDPIYAVVYTVFTIGSCALLSMFWINFFDISAVDVATSLKDKNMVMLDHNEQSMLIELERYIPTAAVLSGLCIGTLSVLADFIGVFGSGTGVILVAIIIYDYAKLFLEQQNMKEEINTMLF